jgi:hypothetical protein
MTNEFCKVVLNSTPASLRRVATLISQILTSTHFRLSVAWSRDSAVTTIDNLTSVVNGNSELSGFVYNLFKCCCVGERYAGLKCEVIEHYREKTIADLSRSFADFIQSTVCLRGVQSTTADSGKSGEELKGNCCYY